MKPRTRIHKRVDELSKKLKRITNKHIKWANETLFEQNIYETSNQCECLECGHIWPRKYHNDGDRKCPKCKKRLQLLKGKTRTLEQLDYFAIFQSCEEYQVLRYFMLKKKTKSKCKPYYIYSEVIQHWISPEGKLTIRAMRASPFSYCFDSWIISSDIEIRHNDDKWYVNNVEIYPEASYIPSIIRNGFYLDYFKINPSIFFQLILSSTQAETLLKTDQIQLLEACDKQLKRVIHYWNQIKICIRNNYRVTDPASWFDQLDLLQYFHKDIYNPKYICPDDLEKEHKKYIERKKRVLLKEKIEALKEKIKTDNEILKKTKGKFFKVKFESGPLKVVVLNSVEEYIKEGDELGHCLFSSEYHKKKNSLILSARKDNQRLETIEVALPSMKVIQCRGKNNKDTEYHKEIIQLVENNTRLLKKAAR